MARFMGPLLKIMFECNKTAWQFFDSLFQYKYILRQGQTEQLTAERGIAWRHGFNHSYFQMLFLSTGKKW